MRPAQARRVLSSALASRRVAATSCPLPPFPPLCGYAAAPGTPESSSRDALCHPVPATVRCFSETAPGTLRSQAGIPPQRQSHVSGLRAELPGARSELTVRCFSQTAPGNVNAQSEVPTQSQSHVSGLRAEFPGARSELTSRLAFVPERAERPVPCFQVLDLHGEINPGAEEYEVEAELAVAMYRKMVQLQAMDTVFYEAQRQGRFSFYLATSGEEAINIASAAALSHEDHVFAQYREPGVLLWRGYSFEDFSNQCFGNKLDSTKGRQMPIHYGSAALRYQTISSPLATQIPHAVGAAYGLKANEEKCCAVAYFGEGAASEGDFHGALNFAAVLEAPVLFICRNNGWAISTPAKEQYRGDGIAGRGQAYGVRAIRVDGNDALAVYAAVKESRRIVVEESRPVLLEALTYRTGHHSTSDDSSRYRGAAEIAHWKTERDPTQRFLRWLVKKGWWDERDSEALREQSRAEVIAAMEKAEKEEKPPLTNLFTDVYDETTPNLLEQSIRITDAVRKNPSAYPQDLPLASSP